MNDDPLSIVNFSHALIRQTQRILRGEMSNVTTAPAPTLWPRVALDATVGNGNDLRFLCEISSPDSTIIGVDVQSIAIERCQKLLEEQHCEARVKLVLRSHDEIDSICRAEGIMNLDVVMYNLGYLPGTDKKLRTQAQTSIASLEQAIGLLSTNGIITICCYVAHEGGLEERNAIQKWMSELDPKKLRVMQYKSYESAHTPECYVLQKRV